MKKTSFLSVLFVLLAFGANAQTQQGNWVASGKTGLDFISATTKEYYDGETDSDSDYKQSSISVSPSVGYFVIDNLAVGLSAAFQSYKDKTGNDDWSDPSTAFAIMPFATYYIPLQGQVRPFVGVGGGFGGVSEGDDDADKFSGLALGGNAGVAIFLNDKISLDLGAQYIHTNYKNKDDNDWRLKTGSIGAMVGFSVYF